MSIGFAYVWFYKGWSHAVVYPEWGTIFYIADMYLDQETFDFSQGHVTKNQPKAFPV